MDTYSSEILAAHYTSLENLISILKCGNIWATNIMYLNDKAEYHESTDFIKNEITDRDFYRHQLFSDITGIDTLLDTYISYISEKFYVINPRYSQKIYPKDLDISIAESLNYFVCSFSEDHDLLSQWRSYCKPNTGCNIVFDLNGFLSNLAGKHSFQAHLCKCIYDDSDKLEKLRSIVHKHLLDYAHANENGPPLNGLNQVQFFGKLWRMLIKISLAFKNKHFSAEREWRIILQDVASCIDIQYRAGASCLVPYIKLEFDLSNIKGFYIGPTNNENLSRVSLYHLVERKFNSVNPKPFVNLSSIPYRSI